MLSDRDDAEREAGLVKTESQKEQLTQGTDK